MKRVFSFFLIFLLLSSTVFGGKKNVVCRFERIRFENGVLCFNFYSNNILDKKLLTSLKKGLTATLEYKVQLWKKNKYFPDSIEKERIKRIKISYDRWQKGYIVTGHDNKSKIFSSDEIISNCSTLENFKILDIKALSENKEYRIIIRVLIRKLSLKNYEEIKKWLEGRAEEFDIKSLKNAKPSSKKATNWVVSLLLNVSGFGDKIITGKSEWFKVENKQITSKIE